MNDTKSIIRGIIEGELPGDYFGKYRPDKFKLFGMNYSNIGIPCFLRIKVDGIVEESEHELKFEGSTQHTTIGGIGKRQWFGQRCPIYDYRLKTTLCKSKQLLVFYASCGEEREDILRVIREIEVENSK